MGKQKRTKVCSRCHKELSLNKFHNDKTRKDNKANWCKRCVSVYNLKWYEKNREKLIKLRRERYSKNIEKYRAGDRQPKRKEKQRNAYYKRKYGITLKDYNSLLEKQNYRCAICNRYESELKQRLVVDHSHKTNYIRGLLCHYCNHYILSRWGDNKRIVQGLVKYLTKALKKDKTWEE